MKKYFLVALLIAFSIVVALILFKEEGKNLLFSLRRDNQPPSFFNALPFERNKDTQRGRHKLLIAKLNNKQIYLDEVIITPKNSPRGAYVALALVVEFKDKEIAKKVSGSKDILRNLIIERSSHWDYTDFKSPDGLSIIKKEILNAFRKKFGDKVEKVYLTEYKFYRQKRL